MSDNVLRFKPQASQNAVREWECNCGCGMMKLYEDGHIECADCGEAQDIRYLLAEN